MRQDTSRLGTILLSLFLTSACAQDGNAPSGGSSVRAETSYCSTVTSYSTPSTVTGVAQYQRPTFGVTALNMSSLTTLPIRYAEVRVISGGTVVQCSETGAAGQISLQVPDGTYTLQINSRANNQYLNASVLTDPTNNDFYSLTTTITVAGATNIGNVTATTTGTVLGAAFNILDQALNANAFLRAKTTNCGASFSNCTPFTVAPKAKIYWKLGFNPYTYFGGTSGLSFYLPGYSELYILGGLNGDPNNTDTDHFDNAVIIHEYGHFIEDSYSTTNSPGGSHNGNSIIDPRLAWGEGWANFFGVTVNSWATSGGDTLYRDSYGNSLGSLKGYLIKYDLEDNSPSSRDVAGTMGEGNFREFSIARALYDTVDDTASETMVGGGTDTIKDVFPELWTIFSYDWKATSYRFRNYGLFTELHTALGGATNLSAIYTSEKQRASRQDYGTRDAGDGCVSTATISRDTSDNGTFAGSNQFQSNDFYHISHAGGALSIVLDGTVTSGTQDLDLYLYKDGYRYGDSSSIIQSSRSTGPDESISVSLAAGEYMVNVMAYSGSGTATYILTINGGKVCP